MPPTKSKYDLSSLKSNTKTLIQSELGQPQDRRAGGDYYRCPFHAHGQENTPSLAVHDTYFKCHACEARGDVITFFGLLKFGSGWNPRESRMFREVVESLGAGQIDEAAAETYRQADQARRDAEAAKRQKARDIFATSQIWNKWHDSMTGQARELWRQRGLSDHSQDIWNVGFIPDKVYEYKDAILHSPAMTVPIYTWTNGKPSQVVTVNYRLTSPAAGAGKYRFHRGCGTHAWVSHPHLHAGDGEKILVAEGSIKGAVASQLLQDEMQVAAFPSQSDPGGILKELTKFKQVYIWLDPEAFIPPKNAGPDWKAWPLRYCTALKTYGVDARYVMYPQKLDDAILKYGFAARDLLDILRWSRRL